MPQNFGDEETGRLAAEVAKLAGESEEEAVRQALRERRDRLQSEAGKRKPKSKEELRHFMETQIWPLIPEEHRGRPPMSKAERARLLGYGPEDD